MISVSNQKAAWSQVDAVAAAAVMVVVVVFDCRCVE
jgi:hypothetical protein